jgi:hypothetical protein
LCRRGHDDDNDDDDDDDRRGRLAFLLPRIAIARSPPSWCTGIISGRNPDKECEPSPISPILRTDRAAPAAAPTQLRPRRSARIAN